MTRRRKVILVLLGSLLLIQFVPIPRTNPPVAGEIAAPAEVKRILRESCYDCHSHETVWPWYSWVAPISWGVVWDVNEGREHVNFSTWDAYPAAERKKRLKAVLEAVQEGEMPLKRYVWLHPEAALTREEKNAIEFWVRGAVPDLESVPKHEH